MDIAIQFEKIDLDDEKCIFKPVNTIFGLYDKGSQLFITESGLVCYTINTKSSEAHNFFAFPTTIKELHNSYGDDLSTEDLLSMYFYLAGDRSYNGFYNDNDITVIGVDVYDMEESLLFNGKCKYANFIDPTKRLDKRDIPRSNDAISVKHAPKAKTKPKYELKWQCMTPYKILGIEEMDYSKEELLKKLSMRIKSIQKKNIENSEKNMIIDGFLEAYSEIMKSQSNNKTKKL